MTVTAPLLAISGSDVVQTAVDALSLGGLYALLALGIALVFGIMRLINFAYGELIMTAGFALVVLDGVPLALRVIAVVAATVVCALLSERLVFRPLRAATPATLLVASFALSYLLQNLAAAIFGTLPRTTLVSDALTRSFSVAGVSISRLDLLTIATTIVLLAGLAAALARTSIGVQMRAAAEDFRTARLVGVRADMVIALAFGLSGVLAAVAAILLVAKTGSVTPTMGATVLVYAFVAMVIGGMGSLTGAVAGAFAIGVTSVLLETLLPSSLVPYRDAFLFALALVVLVARPQGLVPARAAATRVDAEPAAAVPIAGSGPLPSSALQRWSTLPLLVAIVAIAVAVFAGSGPDSQKLVVVTALVNLLVVVGTYTFVGTSGVFSFGHIAFMAVGAYASAIATIPSVRKNLLFSSMPDALVGLHLAPLPAILLGGALAAVLALIVGAPLMRLSGLNAALGTFALLLIVNSVAGNWKQVTNGATGLGGVPRAVDVEGALAAALAGVCVAFLFGITRTARRLRATREDETAARAAGISVVRGRMVAFVLSAFLVGAAGGVYAQTAGSIQPTAFYLPLTFLTIAMLVVGGMTSLSGAVLGTLTLSLIAEVLRRAEDGTSLGPVHLDAPAGLREIGLALVMLAILMARPSGLTGGRELTLHSFAGLRRHTRPSPVSDATAPADARGGHADNVVPNKGEPG